MTILAIMSLVLALCGATVTGIKEVRTVLSKTVEKLAGRGRAAWSGVNSLCGIDAQANRTGMPLFWFRCTHRLSGTFNAVFRFAEWTYAATVWVPILALAIVAGWITVWVSDIPAADFQRVVTAPARDQIESLRTVLWRTAVCNVVALCVMGIALAAMFGLEKMMNLVSHVLVTYVGAKRRAAERLTMDKLIADAPQGRASAAAAPAVPTEQVPDPNSGNGQAPPPSPQTP